MTYKGWMPQNPNNQPNHLILSERLDFHMDNLSKAVDALPSMLTSPSVDEILLPRYTNWFTNFSGLPLTMKNLLHYESRYNFDLNQMLLG